VTSIDSSRRWGGDELTWHSSVTTSMSSLRLSSRFAKRGAVVAEYEVQTITSCLHTSGLPLPPAEELAAHYVTHWSSVRATATWLVFDSKRPCLRQWSSTLRPRQLLNGTDNHAKTIPRQAAAAQPALVVCSIQYMNVLDNWIIVLKPRDQNRYLIHTARQDRDRDRDGKYKDQDLSHYCLPVYPEP